MADKFVNETGVAAIRDWANGKFAKDADLDALAAEVAEIVAEGGEPNTIDTVKVNGTALTPDAQKAVNVTVPTATSDLTNDGDGESPFATEDFVAQQGGKIDTIKVNGTTQTITNKAVDLAVAEVELEDQGQHWVATVNGGSWIRFLAPPDNVGNYVNFVSSPYYGEYEDGQIDIDLATMAAIPTAVSSLTNDSGYQTAAQVQQLIDDELADITGIDFQVVSALPATGEHGVIYLVSRSGSGAPYDEYIWVTPTGGTAHFEQIGDTSIDLTSYWTSTTGQSNSLNAMTVAEINAILEPSA